MHTGCTAIDVAKHKQGETKRRVTIKAPNMDVAMHTMRLIREHVKACEADEELVKMNRCTMKGRSGYSPTKEARRGVHAHKIVKTWGEEETGDKEPPGKDAREAVIPA